MAFPVSQFSGISLIFCNVAGYGRDVNLQSNFRLKFEPEGGMVGSSLRLLENSKKGQLRR